jgi:allantoinase
MKFDLVIRNGTVVRANGAHQESIAISEGKIVEIAPEIPGDAKETVDATGLHIFPGLIDSHVHFNEPGRTDWEGFETGSSALAAGGGTCFFDMPLNSSPPVLDGEAFDRKREAAEKSSITDFALWGGLTPGNLDRMEELAERGVIGFKAFMCDSGIADFPRADDWTLVHGMSKAAELGLPVAVHAENQELVAGKAAWMRSKMPTLRAADWKYVRDPLAEAEAIGRAALFAFQKKCSLHIVHCSTRYTVEVAANFRRGAKSDISIETCPHYLALTSADVEQLGGIAKCAPPIHMAPHHDQLWSRVLDGTVDIIGSDHSPAPPEMKNSADFFAVWGGIAGVQSTLSILLSRKPAAPLERVAALTSANVATRFKIPSKGQIAVDYDADFAIVDLAATYRLRRQDLKDRHKLSPYVGRTFRGVVKRTILRGQTLFLDGNVVAGSKGKLLKPQR